MDPIEFAESDREHGAEHGESGILPDSPFDELDDLAEASLGSTNRIDLSGVVRKRVEFAALARDLERFVRRLLGLVDVSGEQSPPPRIPRGRRARQCQSGLGRVADHQLEVLVGFDDVSTHDRGVTQGACRAGAEMSITEALGDFALLVRVGRQLVQCRRRPDRAVALRQDLPQREVVADTSGHGERLIAQRSGPVAVAPGELDSQGREQHRSFWSLGADRRRERRSEGVDSLLVDGTSAARPAPVVRQSGAHEQGRVPEALGKISRAEQCLPRSWVASLELCGAEVDQRLAARQLVGEVLAIDELEGLAVPDDGVVGRELGERVVTGTPRVVDGLVRVGGLTGLRPVVGELAEAVAGVVGAEAFEGDGNATVQSLATCGAEIVVERVLDESVGERQAARVLGQLSDQDRADRRVEQLERVIFALVRDSCEKLELEVATDHGGGTQCLFRGLAEPGHAASDDLADAGRQRVVVSEVDVGDPAAVVA